MESVCEEVTVKENGLEYRIPVQHYLQLPQVTFLIGEFFPVPTRVEMIQSRSLMQAKYPDIEVALIYEGLRIVTTGPGLDEIAKEIKRHGHQTMCVTMTEFLTDGVKIYLSPWQLVRFSPITKFYPEDTVVSFWSSMELEDRKIIEIYEDSREEYPLEPKYSMGDTMGEMTSVLRKYFLSPESIRQLQPYRDLTYKKQDGRTHIWINAEIVVKLSFHSILAQHEMQILSLDLPGLPKLLHSWISGDETFLVMENCGNTLTEEYVFEALIPDSIREQQAQIRATLKANDLHHLDDHLMNYVIKADHLTMIDAEVIVSRADYNAFRLKSTEHQYRFPIKYYQTISQVSAMFGQQLPVLE